MSKFISLTEFKLQIVKTKKKIYFTGNQIKIFRFLSGKIQNSLLKKGEEASSPSQKWGGGERQFDLHFKDFMFEGILNEIASEF